MPSARPTVIITRPEPDAAQFAERARVTLGAAVEIVCAPLVEIDPLSQVIEFIHDEQVIFTSRNAVRLAPHGVGRTAFCVGQRTADLALDAGYRAVSADGDASDLINLLKAQSSGPLVHVRGEQTTLSFSNALAALGLVVRDIVAYRQVAKELPVDVVSKILREQRTIVTAFSANAAEVLSKHVAGNKAASTLVAISSSAAAPLTGCFAKTVVASTMDAAGLLAAVQVICDDLSKQTSG
ncbi:uroporphyrinogen-III synthase [Nereida ignava]|nr:uroporphyrinogen-III synthase [Nereida ignava]